MAQCPICSKSISVTEDNYGTLYRCEHCRAEFFIGFDGVLENSKEPNASDLLNDVAVEAPSASAVEAAMPMPSGDEPSRDIFNIDSSNSDQERSDIFAMPAAEEEPARTTENGTELKRNEPNSGAFQNFADDVQNFGNDSIATGVLTFDMEISGIDLGETKFVLLEALDDKRFGWTLPEITQQIKDGKLILTNLSAPKIIVLVKRLTPIGLNLIWRHHVSTQ